MSAREYILLYKMEQVLETVHKKFQNLVEVRSCYTGDTMTLKSKGPRVLMKLGLCFV